MKKKFEMKATLAPVKGWKSYEMVMVTLDDYPSYLIHIDTFSTYYQRENRTDWLYKELQAGNSVEGFMSFEADMEDEEEE